MKTWKVVQWATGGVGRACIEHIVNHPELELVGGWVHSADKVGQDLGVLAGLEPLGVHAVGSLEEVLQLGADCVIYAPIIANPKEVAALLAGGLNVVTPLGWFWPSDAERARMQPACEAGGTTLHGTGIDPGGATELHPLMFSALSGSVTFVRGEEFSDIRTYNAPEVVRHIMGFGQSPQQALDGPMLELLSAGFTQSVQMCLDVLGFADAVITPKREVAVATAPIDSPAGVINPGEVAAQRFAWEAFVGNEKVARVAVNWFMGDADFEPAWTFGPKGERFEIEVVGDPGCEVTVHGWHPASLAEGLKRNTGIVVTAAHLVNSVPAVCAAPAGIATYVDLPLVAGRAHPRLARGSSPS